MLEIHDVLTPADHHTHRRYPFDVPADTRRLQLHVSYAPKRLHEQASAALAQAALARQTATLVSRVGAALAEQWSVDHQATVRRARVANLLTISLDDANGHYRGAGHRHASDQHFFVSSPAASPGLIGGPLPPGQWTLTVSAHTLVSAQCWLSIRIDAEIASSR